MTSPATEAPPAPAPEAPPAPQAQPAAPSSPPAAQVPAPPVPQPPAAPAPPASPQPPQQPPPAPADGTDWKAEAARLRTQAEDALRQAEQWKAQSRRQEARSKQNHTEKQGLEAVVRQMAEKMGVEFDDKPDPEVLQQRLEQQTTLARQRAVELAIFTQAAQAGTVNAAALLDSRDFIGRTSALDPDAADFGSQVADLVREAAGQPRYQFQQAPTAQVQPPPPPEPPAAPAQPPAPSSGADFSGAPGQGALWTQADYDRYMTGAAIHDRDGAVLSKAIEAGLLVNLGIGKPKVRARR